MATYSLPYGNGTVTVELPDACAVEMVSQAPAEALADPEGEIERELQSSEARLALARLSGARTVAIAINDKTRPVPHGLLLPPLLRVLERYGISRSGIRLIVATGTHPPMRDEELADVVPPEILERYRVFSHDGSDETELVDLGETSRGTPCTVCREYYQADFRIVLGNIEPHQFAGFSGGVKSAVIGLAGYRTINTHHALMMDPEARIGTCQGNPAREDIEELGRLVRVDFALNPVLNDDKEIVCVFAGDPVEVMARGVPEAERISLAPVEQAFDGILVSPGGHPKDINVYQSQKALGHVISVARREAPIAIFAACPEGSGSARYEQWVAECRSHADVMARFRPQEFQVGPHKAYQIARDSVDRTVVWYTEMPSYLTTKLLLPQVRTPQEAADAVCRQVAPGGRIGVVPIGNATIPRLRDSRA